MEYSIIFYLWKDNIWSIMLIEYTLKMSSKLRNSWLILHSFAIFLPTWNRSLISLMSSSYVLILIEGANTLDTFSRGLRLLRWKVDLTFWWKRVFFFSGVSLKLFPTTAKTLSTWWNRAGVFGTEKFAGVWF